MNKLFENKTTYSKEIYIQFLKFHNKTFNFGYATYTIFWTFLFLLCIYLSFGSGERLQGVIITIILIGFVFYRIYHPKSIVDKELKSDKIADTNTNTFSFYDKEFEIENRNGSFRYRYFMIHKIYETPDFFYIYMTRENAFLLSKDTFSLGNKDDFAKILKSKCNFKYKKKC